MYCQNCGAEVDQNYRICPYCGQENINPEFINEKNNKIRDLEQKVTELENIIKEGSKSSDKKGPFNFFQPWIFIFPLVFVVLFFVLFMVLVSIR
ncbi:MAG: zinc-ribbon domain-containing protein [Candidatus Hermodarchaeota archaeon]